MPYNPDNPAASNQRKTYAVAWGDPFDGMTLYGPWDTDTEALQWAEEHDTGEPWTVVTLYEGVF